MSHSAIPFVKVALLGRPNVGKSTLFNRLIRSNRAITHDRPGITRDRMEGIVRMRGEEAFGIIDTGGVTLDSHSRVDEGPDALRGFETALLQQAQEAIKDAQLLCLVVDARDGLTPFDRHLADYLRRSGKPMFIIVNKVDGPEHADLLMTEFHVLGLDLFPCSAAHGFNVRELEGEIRSRLFGLEADEEEAFAQAAEDQLHLDGATKRQRKRLTAAFVEQARKDSAEAVANDAAADDGDDEDAAFFAGNDPLLLAESATADESPRLDDLYEGVEEGDDAETVRPLEDGTFLMEGEHGESIRIYYENPDDRPAAEEELDLYSGPLRLALLGRPNAGKSSLVNAMVGEARMIVSDVAGTTRDSVDVTTMIDGEECTFVDTAGVRRRSKIKDTVERYSVNSSLKSTSKAHVTLLVLDAAEGMTLQDRRLIELLNERKTPFIVVINKVDLVEPKLRKNMEKEYRETLVYCPHVPLLFVSALKKRNLNKIVPLARSIRQECGVRIGTGKLNRSMTQVLDTHQPPIIKGARAKFFYLTQAESSPPTFVFFVNDADRILASYARYLERSLRRLFGIVHAPMRVHFRSSHKKKKK